MLCDACGKNMTMPDGGMSIIGVQINIGTSEAMDESSLQWLIEQMAPFEVNRNYAICFPCWLRSLGVCPTRPADSPMPDDPLIVY